MLLLSFLGFLFIHQAATLPSHGPSMPERAYVIRLAAESEHPDKLSQRDDLHIAAFHKRPSTLAYTVRYEFKHPHVFLGISIQTTGTETDEKTFSQLQALSRVSSISRVDRVSLPITQGSPQISAPGGHILSTWPLGPIEGYSMMYGTSMATPYISGAFALVGSRFPNAKTQEILERLQTTATPPPCVYNSSMLAATPQQGPGVVDVYKTTFSESQISPSQITVTDVSRTKYGKTNVTIQNTSTKPKTYSFSQRSWVYGLHLEIPRAQSAASRPSASPSTLQTMSIPPLPVFSGFLCISDSDRETFNIPYVGPPYSLYNTAHLTIRNDNRTGPISPRIWSYDANGAIFTDYGLEEFRVVRSYGSDLSTVQWAHEFRVDVLPADTNITANHYGFDRTITYPYKPSKSIPNMTIFGYPSFGLITNKTCYIWPGMNVQFWADTQVVSSNGARHRVGNGD